MLLYIFFGGVGYLIIAVLMHIFCEDVLDFDDEIGNALWATAWPLFIAFWLLVGGPALGIHWALKKMAKKLRRGFRKTYTSEVK